MILTFIALVVVVVAVWYFVEKNKKSLDVNKDGQVDLNDVKEVAARLEAEYGPKVEEVKQEVKQTVAKVKKAKKNG